MRAALGVLAAACLAAACGGSSPAAPEMPPVTVPTGPQILRVVLQAPCSTPDGRSLIPLTFTHVTVSRGNNEWIAAASSPDAGDVELRFHQTDVNALNGIMRVAGTVKGTAIYDADFPPAPASRTRANFGADGRTTLNGFAFNASSLTPTAGANGVGSGTITLSDTEGRSCAGSTFVWSLGPQ